MKANELRIGNWVDYEKTTHIITAIDSGNYGRSRWIKQSASEPDYEHTFKEIEPISLTPEILEKAGFHKHNNAWVMPDFNENNYTKDYFTIWDYDGTYNLNTTQFPIELKSLHQLQNLYFALTGEELEINF